MVVDCVKIEKAFCYGLLSNIYFSTYQFYVQFLSLLLSSM